MNGSDGGGRHVLVRLSAAIALLVIIFGGAWALWRWGKLDVWGSVSWHTVWQRPDDGGLLLGVLTVAGWLAWALVLGTVICEAIAAISRGRWRPRLPGSGWLRPAVTALVMATLGLSAAAGSWGGGTLGSRAAVALESAVGSIDGATSTTVAPGWTADGPTNGLADGLAYGAMVMAATAPSADLTPYLVVPGDDLWSLADRFAGGGDNWRVLAEANHTVVLDPSTDLVPGTMLMVPRPVAAGGSAVLMRADVWPSAADVLTAVDGGASRPADVDRQTTGASAGDDDAAGSPAETIVTVQPGDTLWALSEANLGDPFEWPVLYEANRAVIADPDRIYPGQTLVVPVAGAAGAPQANTTGDDAPKGDVPQADTTGGKVRDGSAPGADTLDGGAADGDTASEDTANGDTASEDTANGDTTGGGSANGDALGREAPGEAMPDTAPTGDLPGAPGAPGAPDAPDGADDADGTDDPAVSAPAGLSDGGSHAHASPGPTVAALLGSIGAGLAASLIAGLAAHRVMQLRGRPVGHEVPRLSEAAQRFETALNMRSTARDDDSWAPEDVEQAGGGGRLDDGSRYGLSAESGDAAHVSRGPSRPSGLSEGPAGQSWFDDDDDVDDWRFWPRDEVSTAPRDEASAVPLAEVSTAPRGDQLRTTAAPEQTRWIQVQPSPPPPPPRLRIVGDVADDAEEVHGKVCLGTAPDGDDVVLDLVDAGLVEVRGMVSQTIGMMAAMVAQLLAIEAENRPEVVLAAPSLEWLAILLDCPLTPANLAWQLVAQRLAGVGPASEPLVVFTDTDMPAIEKEDGVTIVTSSETVGQAGADTIIAVISDDQASLRRASEPGAKLTFRAGLVLPPARRILAELVSTVTSADYPVAPWWATADASPQPEAAIAATGENADGQAGWPAEPASDVSAHQRTGSATEPALSEGNAATGAEPTWQHPFLRLFGPVELVGARGVVPNQARKQCLEYCGWLLRYPGQTPVTMVRSLFVAEGTRRSNMSRLRLWLGCDDAGEPYLPEAYSGRIRLHPGVGSDWERMQLLTAEGVNRASDHSLIEALQLVRGAPLADAAPGQWRWAEEWRCDMVSMAHDIALVLSERALSRGDLQLARWASVRGLLVAPEDDRLLAVCVRIEHMAGNRTEVERLAMHITRTASRMGYDLPDETVLLLQEVLEGGQRARQAA